MKDLKSSSAPIPLRRIHFSALRICAHACFFHLVIKVLRAKTTSDSSHMQLPTNRLVGLSYATNKPKDMLTRWAKWAHLVLGVQIGRSCSPCLHSGSVLGFLVPVSLWHQCKSYAGLVHLRWAHEKWLVISQASELFVLLWSEGFTWNEY